MFVVFEPNRSLISRVVLFEEVHRLPQSRPTRSFSSRAVFIPSIDRACTTHLIHPFPYTTSKGEFIQYFIPCIFLFVGVSWPRRRGGSSFPARQLDAQARPNLLSFPKPLSRTRQLSFDTSSLTIIIVRQHSLCYSVVARQVLPPLSCSHRRHGTQSHLSTQ